MHFECVFWNGSDLSAAVECQRRQPFAGFLTAAYFRKYTWFCGWLLPSPTVCRIWVIVAWRRRFSWVH